MTKKEALEKIDKIIRDVYGDSVFCANNCQFRGYFVYIRRKTIYYWMLNANAKWQLA